jgi:hypothetical protein
MQIPSNLMLNKFGKPAIYLPLAMMTWGVISTLTAAAQNYAGLVVIRFFLGFVEAAYFVCPIHTFFGFRLNAHLL